MACYVILNHRREQMSCFGNDEKDAIVEAIVVFARSRRIKNETNREIIYHVMEAVTEGVDGILYDQEKAAIA